MEITDQGQEHKGPFPKKELAIISGIFSVLAVGLLLFAALLSNVMNGIKQRLFEDFKSSTGYTLQYSSMSPSFFRFLEIRDLEIKSAEPEQRLVAKFEKIRIYYNIFELIFSPDKIRAIERLEIGRGDVNLDESKEKKLIRFLEGLLRNPNNEYRLSPRFSLVSRDLSLSYEQDGAHFAIRHLFLSLNTRDSFLSFVLHSSGEAAFGEPSRRVSDYTTTVDMEGKVNTGFTILDAGLKVESLKTKGLVLKEQQFHLGLKEGKVEVTKVQDRSPLDLSLEYWVKDELLSVHFMAEGLKPDSLVTLEHELAGFNPVLSSSVTANGKLRYSIPANDLDFDLELEGALPESVSPIAANVYAKISGTEERIDFSPFLLSSEIGTIEFRGNLVYETLFPEGFLRLVNVQTDVAGDINADFSVKRDRQSVSVKGEKLLVGGAGFKEFVLDIFPRKDDIYFTVNSKLDMPVPDHRIRIDGTYANSQLELEGDLKFIPLNYFYRAVTKTADFLPAVDASLAGVFGNARCSFKTDFQTYSFLSPRILLVDGVNPSNTLEFDVSLNEEELSISRWQGMWADYALNGTMNVFWKTKDNFSFRTAFSLDSEHYTMEGRMVPGSTLVVSGSYDLRLLLVPHERGGQYISLQVANLPIPAKGKTIYATLDWIGVYEKNAGLEIAAVSTKLNGLPEIFPGMKNPSLDATFSLKNEKIVFSDLVYRDDVSTLKGNGSFTYQLVPQLAADGWLYLSDEKKIENYTALINYTPSQGGLNLFFENSPLARFGDYIVRGSVSGTVQTSGPPVDPDINLRLALNNGRFSFEPLTLNCELTITKSAITVESLEGTYSKIYRIIAGRGAFDRQNGTCDFTALFKADYLDPVDAEITLEGEITDFKQGEKIASIFEKELVGRFGVSNIRIKDKAPTPWGLNFSLEKGSLYVAGGPDETIRGVVRRDGAFNFDLFAPFALQGHFEGKIKDNLLDGRAENVVLALPSLNTFINNENFVIQDGTARGNFTFSGPPTDPDFFGLLSIDNLIVSSIILTDKVGPIKTVLEAKEKTLHLKETESKVGNVPVNLLAELLIDHWNIARFALNAKITDTLGAHVRLPIEDYSFDGYVTTPAITLVGDYAGLSVTGSIFVQKCDVVFGQSEKKKKQEENENLVVDLAIKTGKQVEFFWPTRQFPILRVLTEPGAEIKVNYNKLKDEFALVGDIKFKSGDVYYFERGFRIREGSLSLAENELKFDPLINIKAERKVRYNEKDVKITLNVQNQRLRSFEPVFDSDPPLPITERYLALGGVIQNPANGKKDEYISSVISDIGGDVLTQLVLLRPLEDKVKELLNLDGFNIRTQFIKNLIFDTVFNTESSLPSSEAINMGRYLNDTEISFQKYLDEKNDLFFEMVLRIQSDIPATGTSATNQNFGNVNVESEFSLELTTPFFLTIKWTITPQHWETFFLPDNKITFKWGISF